MRLPIAGALLLLAALAPSAEAVNDVRLLRGHHVKIPIEARDQHVVVRGRVNGADSAWIVVDTGAQSSAVDAGFARRLGLRRLGTQRSHGAGGAEQGPIVADVTIDLPGLRIHRDQMDALDLAALGSPAGRAPDIVLGSELFMHHVVVVDYEARALEVWDEDAFSWLPSGVVVPFALVDDQPYIQGTLSLPGRAPRSGRFVIDTGSTAGLLLSVAGAERESVVAAFPRTLEVVGRGVGGEHRNTLGRAASFTIDRLRIERPIVLCVSPGAGRVNAEGTLGNIGGELLRRFRVTFDYPHRRVRFEPNQAFASPFDVDMSGATYAFVPGRGAARVVRVEPRTPAAEAGIREGDFVVTLDGQAVGALGYPKFRESLKQDGREIQLGLRRGDESIQVTLRLRRLI